MDQEMIASELLESDVAEYARNPQKYIASEVLGYHLDRMWFELAAIGESTEIFEWEWDLEVE